MKSDNGRTQIATAIVSSLPLENIADERERAIVTALGVFARLGRAHGFPIVNIWSSGKVNEPENPCAIQAAEELAAAISVTYGLSDIARAAVVEVFRNRATSMATFAATIFCSADVVTGRCGSPH